MSAELEVLKREIEVLKREIEVLKRENEVLKRENEVLKRENAMLKYRAMAAELALYQIGDALRQQSAHADAIVKKVHALNQQFPLGDASVDGVQRVTLQAIRASVPGADKLDDAALIKQYISPVKEEP